MSDSTPIDPYYLWLGIPPEEQPADFYRLLGVRKFETNPDVIESAAHRQIAHVRSFSLGPHSAVSQKLLNELAQAKVVLLNPERRTAYDAKLRGLRKRVVNKSAESAERAASSSSSKELKRHVRNVPGAAAPPPQATTPQAKTPQATPVQATPAAAQGEKPVRVVAGAATPVGATPVASAAPSAASMGPLIDTGGEKTSVTSHTRSKGMPGVLIGSVGAGLALLAVLGIVFATSGGDEPEDPTQIASNDNGQQNTTPTDPTGGNGSTTDTTTDTQDNTVANSSGGNSSTSTNNNSTNSNGGNSTTTVVKVNNPPQKPFVPFADGPTRFDAREARTGLEAEIAQVEWAKYLGREVAETNSLGMQLRLIPPGQFTMGSPVGSPNAGDNEVPVSVELTRPIYLGETEVTQGQWQQVMQSQPWLNQQFTREGHKHAASFVNWEDAQTFCDKLTEQEQAAGNLPPGARYRLPTEAEWEYACRGGSTTPYYFGSDPAELSEYEWWGALDGGSAENERYAHEVGLKKPNPFGLFDMHGNVVEWCADKYEATMTGGQDPLTTSGSYGYFRGGGVISTAEHCRSAYRHATPVKDRNYMFGFRVALTVPDPLETLPSAGSPPPNVEIDAEIVGPLFDVTTARTEAEAQAAQAGAAQAIGREVEETNSVGIKLRVLPAGTFMMGSPESDPNGQDDEKPQVLVTLTKPFYLGVTEVTQGQWQAVMDTAPWQNQKEAVTEGPNFAAAYIDWDSAAKFCETLTDRERQAGKITEPWVYRLPTEAEWEFACRAGTMTTYFCGDDEKDLVKYAFWGASGGVVSATTPQEVGQKLPNAFGLFDMHGNVREWCDGWYQKHLPGGVNPSSPYSTGRRSHRGGDWRIGKEYQRSASRMIAGMVHNGPHSGFRIALAQPVSTQILPPGLAVKPAGDIAPPVFDATQANAENEAQSFQRAWADFLGQPPIDKNSIGMELVLLPPGKFEMGPPPSVSAGGRVLVNLTQPLYLGKSEVTQGQWEAVMGTRPWERRPEPSGPDYPVMNISWEEAYTFCQRLSRRENKPYTLPTEAQWEYACRAGSKTYYYFGDDSSNYARYAVLESDAPSAVAQKLPNAFGLYDMLGNAWEFTLDSSLQHERPPGGNDPFAWQPNGGFTYRGGGHNTELKIGASHYRNNVGATTVKPNFGFRLALPLYVDVPGSQPPVTVASSTPNSGTPAGSNPASDSPFPPPPPLELANIRTSAAQRGWARNLKREVLEDNSVGMSFVLIMPGKYVMGAIPGDRFAGSNEKPPVPVEISKIFYAGRTEVTQAQWKAVMGTQPWQRQSYTQEGDNVAVSHVNWPEMEEFCEKLTEREHQSGKLPLDWKYQLPSEAQWEYLCRAGRQVVWQYGNDPNELNEIAWWDLNAESAGERYAHEVAQKRPNVWGLYDMIGNQWEACADVQQAQPVGGVDPLSTQGLSGDRVHRGGSWRNDARYCRTSCRRFTSPTTRGDTIGFRVIQVQTEVAATDTPEPDKTTPSPGTTSNLPTPQPAAGGPKPQPLDVTKVRGPADVQAAQKAWASYLGRDVVQMDEAGIELVVIPPGDYITVSHQPGAPKGAVEPVTVKEPFCIGRTEVTQKQWEEVMGTTPWKGRQEVKEGPTVAATYLGREGIRTFCAKLNEINEKAGKLPIGWRYDLPTETQWEQACRAGTVTDYSFGTDSALATRFGWIVENARFAGESYPHEVAQKLPNYFGLYDMHGNLFEVCYNVFDADAQNPKDSWVARSGCWFSSVSNATSHARDEASPTASSSGTGFRVALVLDKDAQAAVPAPSTGATSNVPTPQPDGGGRKPQPLDVTKVRGPADVQAAQKAWATYLGREVVQTDEAGNELVVIPPGRFITKSHTPGAPKDAMESLVVDEPFCIGRTEVTQKQWENVMGTTPWKGGREVKEGETVAATYIDRGDIEAFCTKLNEMHKAAGKLPAGWKYDIPTEIQWEHACRAGTITNFYFGDDANVATRFAWISDNTRRGGEPYAHEVAQKLPNAFGLHDTHGNVIEFCHNLFDDGAEDEWIARGGTWNTFVSTCASHARSKAGGRSPSFGCRVALVPDDDAQASVSPPATDVASKPLPAPQAQGPQPDEFNVAATNTPADAQKAQRAWADYLGLEVNTTQGVGIELALIPPGAIPPFGRTILKADNAFYIGKTEVTQAQWSAIMDTAPWTEPRFQRATIEGPTVPASSVTSGMALEFCEKLNEKYPQPDWHFALPNGVQWELACRAGTTTEFFFGDDPAKMGDYAWFHENASDVSENYAHQVAAKAPNPFGLYDVHGNVSEWCLSVVSPSPDRPYHSRGGAYYASPQMCRSGGRTGSASDFRAAFNGFRVVLIPGQAGQASIQSGNVQVASASSPASTPAATGNEPPLLDATQPRTVTELEEAQKAWAKHLRRGVQEVNVIGVELVLVPPGKFKMGFASDSGVAADDKPTVDVTISHPFYISRCELTQQQWKNFMGTTPWQDQNFAKTGSDYPAAFVSWEDAQTFCTRLNARQKTPGWAYRLPTEAEWEYAARAGTQGFYSFAGGRPELGKYAWFAENSRDTGETYPHEVGQKFPNQLGLHDTLGNVWEWCLDSYQDELPGGTDPLVNSGPAHVIRGNGWISLNSAIRPDIRNQRSPDYKHNNVGIRLVLAPTGAS